MINKCKCMEEGKIRIKLRDKIVYLDADEYQTSTFFRNRIRF